MKRFLLAALAATVLAAPAFCDAGKRLKLAGPEDLAPDEIDVSSYPADMQRIYRDILIPYAAFHGGARRFLFSPIVEDAEWKMFVNDLWHSPPCCGACPVLTRDEARDLWKFLAYDSKLRKTGANAAKFKAERDALIERFKKESPDRYEAWLLDQPKEKSK